MSCKFRTSESDFCKQEQVLTFPRGYGYFMASDGLLCSGDAPSSYGETYMNYSG